MIKHFRTSNWMQYAICLSIKDWYCNISLVYSGSYAFQLLLCVDKFKWDWQTNAGRHWIRNPPCYTSALGWSASGWLSSAARCQNSAKPAQKYNSTLPATTYPLNSRTTIKASRLALDCRSTTLSFYNFIAVVLWGDRFVLWAVWLGKWHFGHPIRNLERQVW